MSALGINLTRQHLRRFPLHFLACCITFHWNLTFTYFIAWQFLQVIKIENLVNFSFKSQLYVSKAHLTAEGYKYASCILLYFYLFLAGGRCTWMQYSDTTRCAWSWSYRMRVESAMRYPERAIYSEPKQRDSPTSFN